MDNRRALLETQLPHAVIETDFPGLGAPVRRELVDEYALGDYTLWVVTDRVAPETGLVGALPFKGEVITSAALYWLERTADLAPSPIERVVDPQALILKPVANLPIRLRAYRRYSASLAALQSHRASPCLAGNLPATASDDDVLKTPVFIALVTDAGGEVSVLSRSELLARALAPPRRLDHMLELAQTLFDRGQQIAAEAGLELCDADYDFSLLEGEILIPAPLFHAPHQCTYRATDDHRRRLHELDLAQAWRRTQPDALIRPPVQLRMEMADAYLSLGSALVPGFSPHPGPVKNRLNHALSHLGLLA